MIKFLGSLFKDDPPPETQQPIAPQIPKKIYGDSPIPDSEVVLKIVLIGGAQTGKTSIIRRYLQGCFTHQYIPTIGIDMSTAKLQSKSNPEAEYRIQFCDVAHAEVRGKHHASIFKGAAGIVMVFDCCNVQSVAAVDEWRMAYEESLKNTPRVPMVLFANKSDTGQPVIKAADLDTYCERGGYSIWRLTSARSGNTVIEALDKLLEIAIEFRDLQIASRRRKKPEKLISSKSQLLVPPTGTKPPNPTLGTSMAAATNFASGSLGTSSSSTGSSVNENTPSSSSSSASNHATFSSFPRSSSNRPIASSSSANLPSQKIPTRPPPLTLDSMPPVSTSPALNLAETPKSVAPTTTPNTTNETTTTTKPLVETPTTSSDGNNDAVISSNTTTVNTDTPVNTFSEGSSDETDLIRKKHNSSNNKITISNDQTDSFSLDAASDSLSDADSSSNSANNSATASAHNSTHGSTRNFGNALRNSESMDFSYLNGERPSIFSITNALTIEDIKLSELVNIAEDFYAKLKADLDQLFMNVKPARKSDLQILEFQRFDEYVKLMEALRSHKERSPYPGDGENGDGSAKKLLAPENLQILLSENMKKWNQLIMNLHTEVSLYKFGIFDDPRNNNNNSKSSMKTSASDTMLYRYDHPNNLSTLPSSKSTTGNSPSKSKDSSTLGTPPLTNDQGESLVKRQQPAGARRMGFGFRNVGKNSSAILQLVNPNPTSFSLDSDNISSPPSPYNSVHSPTPSSPSTSPTSSPPMYRSRASSNAEPHSSSGNTPSSTLDSNFRTHMESNGFSKFKSHSRPFSHHTRSISHPTHLPSLLASADTSYSTSSHLSPDTSTSVARKRLSMNGETIIRDETSESIHEVISQEDKEIER